MLSQSRPFNLNKKLTLWALTPQNGQTHSSNSSAKADGLFVCVRPLCEVGA